jgi:hypothetical protein
VKTGKEESAEKGWRVSAYAAYLALLDFIDNELHYMRTRGELVAHLIVWRKTHGWGKICDAIGANEFERRTGLDALTVRKGLDLMAEQGVVLTESTVQTTAAGNELNARRRYTWPLNARVQKLLETQETQSMRVGERITHPSVRNQPTPGLESNPLNQVPVNKVSDQSTKTTDYQPTNRKRRDSSAGSDADATEPKRTFTEQQRAWMADALARYGDPSQMRSVMGEEPPAAIVEQCLQAADGLALQDIGNLLVHRCQHGCKPRMQKGPRGWAWFPAVIRNAAKEYREVEQASAKPARLSDYPVSIDPAILRGAEAFGFTGDEEGR